MKKTFTFLLCAMGLLFSSNAFSIPKLNSYPAAVATIFLDFDGHYVQGTVWNGGAAFYCAASGMTDPQITEAFNRVGEDFRPFDINITTDSVVFLAAPLNKRMRIIITTTSGWCPGVGGVAYIGSFIWSDDTPAFVFSDRLGPFSPKMVGEACSHESGHAIGLAHQSKYDGSNCVTPVESYNSGYGSGETGWAPIMGNSYYRNMSNWNNGPTPYGCTNMQDNLSIIATQNGFTYRADDYPEILNASTYSIPASNFSVNGIIGANADKDAFKFSLATNSNFHLAAVPFNVSGNWIGANLDIKIELYNASGSLITTYDPPASLSITIDTILNAGTYYLKVDGTGNLNTGEYGSLGAYSFTGAAGLPIHDVKLNGTVDKNRHNLNWNIVADEPIKTIVLESSTDGSNFNALTSVAPAADKFSYQPYSSSPIYYRLKVTSVLDQTVYSNTIVLKGGENSDKLFNVSTLVHDEVTVNASTKYRYQVIDINGRTILNGTGLKGINKIDISGRSNGMYIIQLFSNDQRQTERIIKQ
ncbi:MAG TPA: zinc-dependent metalloprotease [Ferruginibacter sp.]|nr:zinc-dependent metalloprotease [Ferruginibacter sp.]